MLERVLERTQCFNAASSRTEFRRRPAGEPFGAASGRSSTEQRESNGELSGGRPSCTIDMALKTGNVVSELACAASDVPPSSWTAGHAQEFVRLVWRLLQARAYHGLRLREVRAAVTYRVEFTADTGWAFTAPLALSPEALAWLQSAQFDLAARVRTH